MEMSRSWNVYDARRPLTKGDFAASEHAADGADAISPPDDPLAESAASTGVAGCVQCAFASETRKLVVERR
jgi:hypothetical protein